MCLSVFVRVDETMHEILLHNTRASLMWRTGMNWGARTHDNRAITTGIHVSYIHFSSLSLPSLLSVYFC